ncbi:PTS system glucose-specific EIICBA component [Candidatus Izimaplasma bacterium HR1]|jgi:glucose-specific phosphotransferase system IIA component|uniref:PTS sugar transporter subunit IIA n=1 Tax=Candidatus Izimoplasma sp. HR1 TaxID=1541959 RepID=UPI0004F917C9|nr:PTS system glucose-specific EIICBA component [Candidatus Izimaplasma bacterium HR1]
MSKIKEVIMLPIKGDYADIEKTPDQVFSNKFLGEGFVIFPKEGKVYAPTNGIIKSVFPTKHAIALTSDKGLDILIHIGLETVKLKGEGFTMHTNLGDTVKQGDLLVEFDKEYIEANADSSATPIVLVDRKKLIVKKVKEKEGQTYITIITE